MGSTDSSPDGFVLGAGDFVGGSESSLLGFCDGWELGTLLGPGDFVGRSERWKFIDY